ncbi:3',5'-cyclic-AMP phosphodiesterase [Oceanobacter sp. 3_MG-2023]|uniref:3',5'-cyclic-AMP phosphodiesterase n=1 Tax=Oceanobacter sp. 3_MG-2023 TaxID=3062622 RepID=UPI0027362E91|nr:3',5'-cyclic-AMP phosphodiesterase [Oceanobacter sp. 3_MG-2023]MDP2504674.1 3',5'-cyclic-AMP phosphodiesterase [Oceanobacter sp. 3_MG-2023]
MVFFDRASTFRLIQITDTHLCALRSGHLLGMNTLDSLRCVLDIIRAGHLNADAMLVTGDISQDGSIESYRCLQAELAPLAIPSFWIPGNHDDLTAMATVTAGTTLQDRILRTPHWQVIMLDSSVSGQVYGELADSELARLEAILTQSPDLHTLVCFHHHPVFMDCRWIDSIGLRNAGDLMAIVSRFSNVRGLLWGHVHQESDQIEGDLRLLSTPSTCVQFAPGTDEFTIDRLSPGFRWLDLLPDGRIESDIKRVEHIEFEVDYSVKGY